MKLFPVICCLLLGACQVVKTVKTESERFPDGKVKTIRQTIVKKNRDFELHNNYRRESRLVREYYHNGRLKTYWKVVYTNGADAGCFEDYYKFEAYDSTGIKRQLLESRCDCMRKKEVSRNARGRVLKVEKTVVKRVE